MNQREKQSERMILAKVRLPILPGDIVTDNIYFPESRIADRFKVLSIYHLLVPFKDGNQEPKREVWANLECVHSHKTPARVGNRETYHAHGLRRIGGHRTLGEYLVEREQRENALMDALSEIKSWVQNVASDETAEALADQVLELVERAQ